MDLRDYLRILRSHWRSITACTLLAIAAAAAVSVATTPLYRSTATLFISTPDAGGVSGAYTGSLFTQQRVRSYVNFVSSPVITQAVVDNLDLDLSAQALSARVDADSPADTSLINVSVTDADATRAQQLAQEVAESFSLLATSLESGGAGSVSNVKITVVRPAETPASPVSPRTRLNLALGALVGLALGVAYAVLRETLDTRVKSVSELGEHVDAPNLTIIAYDEGAPKRPLIVQDDPRSPRSEAFRQLRTNLQFVDVDAPPRSIVVTSAVPGEGKTTTACNLAITLADAGINVILVEADLRRPRVGDYLGIESAVGLTSVLVGRADLYEAVQEWGTTGRLSVLPAGAQPPNPSELLASHQMDELLRRLEQQYLVIIDAPPLLPVTDGAVLTSIASGALLVVRGSHTRREQVRQAAENLRSVDGRIYGTVYNMAPAKGPDAYAYGYDYGYTTPDARSGSRRRDGRAAARAGITGPS